MPTLSSIDDSFASHRDPQIPARDLVLTGAVFSILSAVVRVKPSGAKGDGPKLLLRIRTAGAPAKPDVKDSKAVAPGTYTLFLNNNRARQKIADYFISTPDAEPLEPCHLIYDGQSFIVEDAD